MSSFWQGYLTLGHIEYRRGEVSSSPLEHTLSISSG